MTTEPSYRGVIAIPITPFDDTGALDTAALARVVEFSIENGAAAIVGPVFVSEFFALTDDERQRAIETMVTVAGGEVPVIAGVSAPTTHQALEAVERASEVDIDAVIAMPPYFRLGSADDLIEYFSAIAARAQRAVFIQNAPYPAGIALSAGQLSSIIQALPGPTWVKEESASSSAIISELKGLQLSGLAGVIGGVGGRFLLDEYARGVDGTMPGGEFTDLHVALWSALEEHGEESEEARDLYEVLLPLVTMESQYGIAFCKEVYRRRGLISDARCREPNAAIIDDAAGRLLDRLLDRALSRVAGTRGGTR